MSQDHADPVVVASYETEFEASMVKNMLAEEGIPCELMGAMTSGFRAETPGKVRVLVPASLAERALELLIAEGEGRGVDEDELPERDDPDA